MWFFFVEVMWYALGSTGQKFVEMFLTVFVTDFYFEITLVRKLLRQLSVRVL